MVDKRVVDAVSATADHVVCPCGALIELEPDPDPPSVLPVGGHDLSAAIDGN
jgi:hypothetical protein